MAGGEGGFSTKAMGFDKKEVNDYIANLNQRMKEIESEKKANDEKTQKALRMAQDADAKIKAAKEEGAKKIADLELQLKTERRNEENLLIQIDDLKRKLKQGGGSAGGKEAEAIIANANATAKDIINKANATAKDTVEKAKAAANQMVSQAQSAGGSGVNSAAVDEFMKVLSGFMNSITSGANEVNQKASELLGAQSAAPVTVPDFSNIAAPQANAPKAEAPKPAAAAKTGKAAGVSDDLFAMLEEDDASAESADNDEDAFDMVTEVEPLDDPANAPGAVVLDEFDLSGSNIDLDLDAPVSEVKPIDNKNKPKVDLSEEFEKQILAQTVNSSMLREELDEEILASVKQQEEHFAVKPNDDDTGVGDLDMDSSEDEDPLTAMLKQAELTFGGGGAASLDNTEESEPEPESSSASEDSSNPWAALQNELMAMEKSGDLGSSDIETDTGSSASDTAVPNTDDSAIWDFGDDSSNSSDDDDMGMSSDMFGNF